MANYQFMIDVVFLLGVNFLINLASLVISVLAIRKTNATNKIIDQLNLRLDQLVKRNYSDSVNPKGPR
jgi:hypothetical protein